MRDNATSTEAQAEKWERATAREDDWPARLGPCPPDWDGYLPSGEEIAP